MRRIIQKASHEDPTMKDGRVYDRKVDVIRDTLDEVTKVEFDLLMQTEVSMRPSIYVYKRVVIPTIQSSWKTSIIVFTSLQSKSGHTMVLNNNHGEPEKGDSTH